MLGRINSKSSILITGILAPLAFATLATAQPASNPGQPASNPGAQWGNRGNATTGQAASSQATGAHTTPFTSGLDTLPNSAGQVWRNYDISAYTSKFNADVRPERQIVDWILRETGTDLWFGEPLGILSATNDTLRVYHTPEVQKVVHQMLDRFTDSANSNQELTFRLVTVGNPNWRSRAFPVLRTIDLQTPGIQAWLVSKENAALLIGELRRRGDFVEHQAPNLTIANGQTRALTRTQPVTYSRSLKRDANGWLLPTVDMGRIDEGYTLEMSPLYDQGGAVTEAIIKATVSQVEKLQTVAIDIPLPTGTNQRVQIQVPQIASFELHERFRWPSDQVLLLSCGVVAAPGPEPNGLFGITKMLDTSSPRADALLFIENVRTADRVLYSGAAGQPQSIGR